MGHIEKQGATYWLANNQGKSHDYKLGEGNWFPAYAYTGNVKLKPAYERSSGGDYGNGLNALTISKINFINATHFTEGTNGGVLTPNSSAWKKSGNAGTYRIYGHTIEFTYQDGKNIKTSFALGAKGPPIKPVNTLIFIGGYAYTYAD